MSLLQMSVTAGVLILGIVFFRSLFLHRLPKRIMLILWEIAMIRLLVPMSIAVPLPDVRIPALSKALDVTCVQAERFVLQEWVETEVEISVENGQTVSEESVSEKPVQLDAGFLVNMIYLTGVLLMASVSLFLYLRDSGILRESLPMTEEERKNLTGGSIVNSRDEKRLRKINFRVSDRIVSPVTYGIFCPCIIFPKGMMQRQEYETGFCIRHELVHIKNHDNLKKLFVHIVLCLHWFNPLVFLMYFLYSRDMELFCDETVIKEKEESRKDYALTLLSMAEQRRVGFTMGSGFGKNAVEERIVAIMKFKKVSLIGIIAAVIAVTASLTVFITNSVKKEEAESTAYAGAENTIVEESVSAGENTAANESGPVNAIETEEKSSETELISELIQEKTAEAEAIREQIGQYDQEKTSAAGQYEEEILELQKIEVEIEILKAQLRAELEAEKVRLGEENSSDPKDGWTQAQFDDDTGWVKNEYYLSNDSVQQQATEDAYRQKKTAAAKMVGEGAGLPEATKELIEEIVEEYGEYGLSVEFRENDYQLYFQGELVYYFADNKKQDGDGFEGQVFSKSASDKNGYTAIVTKRDEEGKVIGLIHLSKEEAEDYRDGLW